MKLTCNSKVQEVCTVVWVLYTVRGVGHLASFLTVGELGKLQKQRNTDSNALLRRL